ncbi:uncharacterized protein [Primulina eburnea]|uniref:uncharacterized protein n=1 Tax=Primulina eburnea TaxID=1245227 RepID=UPI003C6C92C8
MTVSLSDDDTDEERDLKEGDDCTSLSAIQKDIYKLQVNPYGVATGVETPGRNTVTKSLCLNAKSIENSDVEEIQVFDQEELTVEIVQMMYEELYVQLSKKDLELCKVNDDLEKASKTLAKFNSSSSKLDTILTMGKDGRTGLGYVESIFEHGETSNAGSKTPVFVKGVKDHTVPVLHEVLLNTKHNTTVKKTSTKQIWVPKTRIQCNIIYTSLKTNIAGILYFDSGCSRHMTGTREYLTDYVEVTSGRVTYGGGAKGKIVGKGTLKVEGLPQLHNVLHVEGLNSNIIRISQLCDDDLNVKSNKNSCEVFNNSNICIMTGARSTENCYQLGESNDCCSAKTNDLDLWHQKLGHVSFKTLKKLCKFDAVRGNSEEDGTEGILDTSETLTSPGVVTGAETSKTTPDTKPPPNSTDIVEQENEDDDDVIINLEKDIPSKIQKNHPSSQIIVEVYEDVQTREKEKVDYRKMIGMVCMNSTYSQVGHSCFISLIESKNVNDALKDEFWARLVAQGYTQVEGVDFDETFAPVARMEAVRLFLPFACHMRIKLYQMDVKSAFLNGILNEEAYVCQPKGFEDPHHMDHVYKLTKGPVWIETGSTGLVRQMFSTDSSKHVRTPMESSEKLSKDGVAKGVDNTLYRSIIGSLLYLTATRPDIMFIVCLCARYQADPKISHLKALKRILRYIAGTLEFGLWYTHDTNTNLVGFSDSDWAGDLDDRKSTSGGCFYLGNNLVSWASKKQNCVSLSTAESEYVAAASCCSQLMWINQMINDYGFHSEIMIVYCDNASAIDISKNPVQHSRTKHIDIRHHFIRDLVEKGIIRLEFVRNENQLADIFTKPVDFERFSNLRKSLSMCVQ